MRDTGAPVGAQSGAGALVETFGTNAGRLQSGHGAETALACRGSPIRLSIYMCSCYMCS